MPETGDSAYRFEMTVQPLWHMQCCCEPPMEPTLESIHVLDAEALSTACGGRLVPKHLTQLPPGAALKPGATFWLKDTEYVALKHGFKRLEHLF